MSSVCPLEMDFCLEDPAGHGRASEISAHHQMLSQRLIWLRQEWQQSFLQDNAALGQQSRRSGIKKTDRKNDARTTKPDRKTRPCDSETKNSAQYKQKQWWNHYKNVTKTCSTFYQVEEHSAQAAVLRTLVSSFWISDLCSICACIFFSVSLIFPSTIEKQAYNDDRRRLIAPRWTACALTWTGDHRWRPWP